MRREHQAETEGLASALRVAADGITHPQPDGAPLRELQRKVHALVNTTADPYVRTLGFIIDQWIKDYYYNFAGDVMSSAWAEVEAIRADLLKDSTSQAFIHLASALSSDSKGDGFAAIEELVSFYLAAIDEANGVVSKAYGGLELSER